MLQQSPKVSGMLQRHAFLLLILLLLQLGQITHKENTVPGIATGAECDDKSAIFEWLP